MDAEPHGGMPNRPDNKIPSKWWLLDPFGMVLAGFWEVRSSFWSHKTFTSIEKSVKTFILSREAVNEQFFYQNLPKSWQIQIRTNLAEFLYALKYKLISLRIIILTKTWFSIGETFVNVCFLYKQNTCINGDKNLAKSARIWQSCVRNLLGLPNPRRTSQNPARTNWKKDQKAANSEGSQDPNPMNLANFGHHLPDPN